jgi:hypothetical protein
VHSAISRLLYHSTAARSKWDVPAFAAAHDRWCAAVFPYPVQPPVLDNLAHIRETVDMLAGLLAPLVAYGVTAVPALEGVQAPEAADIRRCTVECHELIVAACLRGNEALGAVRPLRRRWGWGRWRS